MSSTDTVKCKCGATFAILTDATDHVEAQHPEVDDWNSVLTLINNSSSQSQSVGQRLRANTGGRVNDRYECDVCGKYFLTYNNLRKHKCPNKPKTSASIAPLPNRPPAPVEPPPLDLDNNSSNQSHGGPSTSHDVGPTSRASSSRGADGRPMQPT